MTYATKARERGFKVIIAGAGGAAHLPGMVASLTSLPVIGVPIKSSNSLDGWDSILSILQMPNGIPVATVALNASKNAGILAASIFGIFDEKISKTCQDFKKTLETEVNEKIVKLKKTGGKIISIRISVLPKPGIAVHSSRITNSCSNESELL